MNYRFQQFAAWGGIILILTVFTFLIAMGFFPPPGPGESAEEVAAHYASLNWVILLGGSACVQMSALGIIWCAVVSVQLRRIEGDTPAIFSTCALVCGLLANSLFVYACGGWVLAAFRPDRAPEIIMAFNDWAFLLFLMTIGPLMGQALSIAAAIFSDESQEPVFPRWAAFFNCWVAAIFLPACLIPFFKAGPFAWTGLFGLWLPVPIFGIWVITMSVLVLSALKRQRADSLDPQFA